MRRTILLFAILGLFASCAKDYGEPATKNFPISGTYTGLSVSHSFQVTVSDQVTDVVVTVGEKALDKVKVEIKDGTLHIGFGWWDSYNGTATAVIPAGATIDELDLSGASSFKGDLSGLDVDIDLSGASVYKGNVTATDLDVDLSGASIATVSGDCQNTMDIEISGASKLHAADLNTQSVKGGISGASTADVTCCTSLKVNLSGASKLTYGTTDLSCNPVVDCETTGSSTVSRR